MKVPFERVLRVKYFDGAIEILRKIEEYVSGKTYFFLVQDTGDGSLVSRAIHRDDIEEIERKLPNGSFYPLVLKKRD